MKDIVSKLLLCQINLNLYESPGLIIPKQRRQDLSKTLKITKKNEFKDMYPSLLTSPDIVRVYVPIPGTFIKKRKSKIPKVKPFRWKTPFFVISVLHCAISSKNWEIFCNLISAGCNPNVHQESRTVLQYAFDHSIPLKVFKYI